MSDEDSRLAFEDTLGTDDTVEEVAGNMSVNSTERVVQEIDVGLKIFT